MSTSAATPDKRDLRLLVAGTVRALGVGDSPLTETITDPSIEQIIQSLPPVESLSGVLLSGGEPTLRKDLPALLTALHESGAPRLGIATDGLVLSSEKAVQFLKKSGLKRVRIGFHSGRTDAHDWIVGISGAAKRVHKAIRTCVDADLEVEVEALVPRPTSSFLEETVELLARLRVQRIFLRRLEGRNNATDHFIAASPRLGPSQAHIEGAIRIGEAWGVPTLLQSFPHCAAEIDDENFQAADEEWWFAPTDSEFIPLVNQFVPAERIRGCRDCPTVEACAGAPEDYVRCFGRLELNAKSSMPTGKSEVSEEEEKWAAERLSNAPPAPRLALDGRLLLDPCSSSDSTNGICMETPCLEFRNFRFPMRFRKHFWKGSFNETSESGWFKNPRREWKHFELSLPLWSIRNWVCCFEM